MAVTTNRLGLLAAALLVLPATHVRGAGALDLGFGTNGRAVTVAATVGALSSSSRTGG